MSGPGLDDLLDLQANLAQVDVEVLEDVGGDAGAFLDQAEQDVLGADVLVVEALRLLIGELHHLAGPVGESFVHLRTSPACRLSRRSQRLRALGTLSVREFERSLHLMHGQAVRTTRVGCGAGHGEDGPFRPPTGDVGVRQGATGSRS